MSALDIHVAEGARTTLSPRRKRRYLGIQNNGDKTIRVGLDDGQVDAFGNGLRVEPGQYLVFDVPPIPDGLIEAVADGGAGLATVVEW